MKTKIVGILNVTPDSFSDGGNFDTLKKAVSRALKMVAEGAEIVDIGGESTRPGAEEVSPEIELGRVLPVVVRLKKELSKNVQISIDTYKSEVAEKCLKAGADMVNVIGGFRFDEKMINVVAKYKCPVIIYHIKGVPRSMQQGEIHYDDVVSEISDFFKKATAQGVSGGIKKDRFILDPGIGFGKTIRHNLEIIKRLGEFKSFNLPILIGVSRKSHIGKMLQEKLSLPSVPLPDGRLEGSLAETAVAVLNGASIVRTHDVLETRKFLLFIDSLQ